MSKPKYAVVVVHGIGVGTGDERKGFSDELKAGVVKYNPECGKFWFEAPWEGLNDLVDSVVKKAADELFNSYIRDADAKNRRAEKLISKIDVNSGWLCWKWCKKGSVWLLTKIFGAMPVVLRKAKRITPNALDAVLDLPIYLGEKAAEIRGTVTTKIDEAMKTGVDGIVLVGHSLGSVIAFDVLREELSQRHADSRINALVTLGSPVEWVAKIRHALENGTGIPSFEIQGVKWINYYDPQDPVPLRRELNSNMFKGVENVSEVSGEILIDAHCAYWKSPRIAKRISALMNEGT